MLCNYYYMCVVYVLYITVSPGLPKLKITSPLTYFQWYLAILILLAFCAQGLRYAPLCLKPNTTELNGIRFVVLIALTITVIFNSKHLKCQQCLVTVKNPQISLSTVFPGTTFHQRNRSLFLERHFADDFSEFFQHCEAQMKVISPQLYWAGSSNLRDRYLKTWTNKTICMSRYHKR